MSIRSLFRKAARRQPRTGSVRTKLGFERLENLCLPSFLTPVPYEALNSQLARGDFNGDGRLDLAVANSSILVLIGNADGTFQTPIDLNVGAVSIATGDFNSDGKLDLATADYSAAAVLMGNGDGTFQPAAAVNTGSWAHPVSVAVGDFNADGKLDLGVASSYYVPGSPGWYGWYPGYFLSQASVLLGSGTGSFTPTSAVDSYFATYGYDATTFVADTNNDGKQDLVIGGDAGSIQTHFGNGAGGLGGPIGSYGTYGSYSRTALGDVNGDGTIDAVSTDTWSGGVNILLGNGQGNFIYDSSRVDTTNSTPYSVALADFNGDGKLDVAAVGSQGEISVLLGTGTGTFRPPLLVGAGQNFPGIMTGDFNGDGRQDLVAAGSVLLNDGDWIDVNAPSITVNNYTVTEGNTGTTAATFTVSLSATYSQPVTVHFATQDGTAGASDYGNASGTLTFAPGDTTKTVTVPVIGDRVAEATETFQFLLSGATNAFIVTPRATGTIVDDEPLASIDYGPVYVTEGNSGSTVALFTIRISSDYDVPFGVNYSTFEGDTDFPQWGYYGYYPAPPAATAGADFQTASGTLTFAPGETVKTVPVSVLGDLIGESDEYFSLNLTDPPAATQWSRHAVAVILDDEPRISISDPSVTEGNTGTKNMTFTVTLSKASTAPITVEYATSDGSASAAEGDYQAKSGTVSFAPGETSKTFTVAVNGDRRGEYDESFYVNLANATGAVIDKGYAYGTILDDEARLNISDASITEGNKGTKTMTFTVTLSAAYDQDVTVRFATYDYSATAGVDYVAKSGTLTFKPGETKKTITITIKGDTKREGDEYFVVSAESYSSNAMLWNWSGWGSIIDDDGRKGKNW